MSYGSERNDVDYLTDFVSEQALGDDANTIKRSRATRTDVELYLSNPVLAVQFPTNKHPIWSLLDLLQSEGFDTDCVTVDVGRVKYGAGDRILVLSPFYRARDDRKRLRYALWELS